MLCFCSALMPNSFWVLQKGEKATNIKLHPALSALIPSHAYTPYTLLPPSLQSSAPRPRLHAMLREELVLIQQTPHTPPHPQKISSPCLFSLSSSSPFLLIMISVLNFHKHTQQENATVLPEQLSLCFQTAYYHQNGWIFSLSPIFFPLAKFLSLPHI